MVDIRTYQDLLDVGQNEKGRMDFVLSAIQEHKQSEQYRVARDAELYASGRNATIMNYQKLLYTLSGNAVPDNYTANHKCASGFFKKTGQGASRPLSSSPEEFFLWTPVCDELARTNRLFSASS